MRVVCLLQGKGITAAAAAKRHTVVLTAEGDVYTWGHKVVTPKRVQLAGGHHAMLEVRTLCSGLSGCNWQSCSMSITHKYALGGVQCLL